MNHFDRLEQDLEGVCAVFKTSPENILEKAKSLIAESKGARKTKRKLAIKNIWHRQAQILSLRPDKSEA